MDREYKRIRCGRLYDGVTEQWKENWQILVEADFIANASENGFSEQKIRHFVE